MLCRHPFSILNSRPVANTPPNFPTSLICLCWKLNILILVIYSFIHINFFIGRISEIQCFRPDVWSYIEKLGGQSEKFRVYGLGFSQMYLEVKGCTFRCFELLRLRFNKECFWVSSFWQSLRFLVSSLTIRIFQFLLVLAFDAYMKALFGMKKTNASLLFFGFDDACQFSYRCFYCIRVASYELANSTCL